MKVAICDNNEYDRHDVHAILTQFFLKRQEEVAITEYALGETMLADIEEGYEDFDLIFLDIFMGGLNGMQVATSLRERGEKVRIVFMSTSSEFAVDSYEVEASGYLTKPLDAEKVNRLLARLMTVVKHRYFMLNSGQKDYCFAVSDIMWVESRNHNIQIHAADHTVVEFRKKLDEIEQLIDDDVMLRCHQSYLVNMEYVRKVDDCFHMRDGSRIPLRVRSRKQIKDTYYLWLMSQMKSEKRLMM